MVIDEKSMRIAKGLRQIADALDRGQWAYKEGNLDFQVAVGDTLVIGADGSRVEEGLTRIHGDVTFNRIVDIPAPTI